MATVISMTPNSQMQIAYVSTSGNQVTFQLTAEVTFNVGEKCIKFSHSVQNNTNFPTSVPELHYTIIEDTSGTNVVTINELVTVTMNDIYEPMAITAIVKEDGNVKGSTTYHENPLSISRG